MNEFLQSILRTELGNGWRYRVDKDGRFVQYHHGDVIMRADDRGWIVRVGLNTESGNCHSIVSGMEAARACLVRRINASLSPIGLSITPIGVSP